MPSVGSLLLFVQCDTDGLQWENEFQRIIDETERAEAFVPTSCAIVFRVDSQSDSPDLVSDCNGSFGRGQK